MGEQLIGLSWWVYMVRCSDGTLYTGITDGQVDGNPKRRVETHNAGKGAKYTRSRRPVVLVYARAIMGDRAAAQREEARIKRLSRAEKLKLIEDYPVERNRWL